MLAYSSLELKTQVAFKSHSVDINLQGSKHIVRRCLHCRKMDTLPEELIVEICKRLPASNRVMFSLVSRYIHGVAFRDSRTLDLQVRNRMGIQDAVGVLEAAAQLNGPGYLLHLRVNETPPQNELSDANRNGVLEFKTNLLNNTDSALRACLNDRIRPSKPPMWKALQCRPDPLSSWLEYIAQLSAWCNITPILGASPETDFLIIGMCPRMRVHYRAQQNTCLHVFPIQILGCSHRKLSPISSCGKINPILLLKVQCQISGLDDDSYKMRARAKENSTQIDC